MHVVVAAVQYAAVPGNWKENLSCSESRVEEAAAKGARIIVLPELISSGYTTDIGDLRSAAESISGPTVYTWQKMAKAFNAVIVGGFCEVDDGQLFNSAVLVRPDGNLLRYRKLHLFDQEKLVFSPGNIPLAVSDTPFGRIGVCICYDLRFVEVMRVLALLQAEIIAVPTAWVAGFDQGSRDDGGLIGQARSALVQANLNQVFVACASQSGVVKRQRFLGSSLIANPYGRLLSDPLGESEEGIALAEVDTDLVKEAQHRSPLICPRLDRRTDMYELRVAGQPL